MNLTFALIVFGFLPLFGALSVAFADALFALLAGPWTHARLLPLLTFLLTPFEQEATTSATLSSLLGSSYS